MAANDPAPALDHDLQALVSYLEMEPQPAIVLNTTYDILAANAAYRRQFGGGRDAHVGRKCYRVSHHYDVPCDRAGEHCPMAQAIGSGGPDRVLHIHHTPRGPEHVDVELRPVFDDSHRIVAFVERLTTVRNASARPSADGLVGSSAAFNSALSAVRRVGPSSLPVLLLGESGTGKELFARAVHEASGRSAGPFVVVDCSGLAETLFESELFGHERGAFTGASARKQGLVEIARGGTLFLDEIGDVPLAMQVKLLRLLETGTFRRVGAVESLQADFRLVAATHKPLRRMIESGAFRQDLFYRISAFPVVLPPLRDRPDDIPLLIESMLRRGAEHGRTVSVDAAALQRLRRHSWPGNVRELRNALERARLFADDGVIRVEHLSLEPGVAVDAPAPMAAVGENPATEGVATDPESLRRAAADFRGTRRELARRLGLSERTLYRRLRDAGVDVA
jgi:transcriptional regulator with PAS, ATPase and Fis domain